jgi:predicted transcriptional regulator
MQANRMPPGLRADMPVQRAVLALALASNTNWRTVPELAREIGDREAVERAVGGLVEVGLLERHKASVRPSAAAAHFERLQLP